MKFTKLALASAAAFGLAGAASATDLVADGLEDWTVGTAPSTGYNDQGGIDSAGDKAVWFGGSEADETEVKLYIPQEGDAVAPYAGQNMPGGIATGFNYLKVSNSNPLWRMINPYTFDPADLPTTFPAQENTNVAVGEGLYIDTLVQFTPSEDAPTPEEGSKLIVWMNAESNLCVTASKLVITESYEPTFEVANFVTGKSLEVGEWYRLTVKAYDTVLDDEMGNIKHGFEVYVDGTAVLSAEAAYDTSSDAFAYGMGEFAGSEELEADFNAGKLFLSMSTLPSATLAAVGFKGEGLVDDIVVTDVDPFPAGAVTGIDFTLTWGSDVSAVWYSVDGGTTKVELSAVPVGAINLPTAEAGDEVIIGGTAADAWSSVAETTNVLAATGNAYMVTAVAATTGGGAGVEDEALATWTPDQIKAAFGDTVTPEAVNLAAEPYLDYQFGQNLGTLSAAPTVKITDIAENATAGWDITVKMFAGDNALNIEDGTDKMTIRAALKVKQSSTLAGLESAEPGVYDLTFDSDKTDITVTVDAGSFFKAFVEFVGAPTPSNE